MGDLILLAVVILALYLAGKCSEKRDTPKWGD